MNIGKILASNTFRNIGIVLAGNVFSVLLGFSFVILTARKLGPEEFGIFSTILAYSIFISAISDLGISQSLVKFFHEAKDRQKQKEIVNTSLFSVLVSSVIISMLASLIYNFWLRNLWHHHTANYTVVLFIMNVVIAINTFLLAFFQTRQNFIKRALIDNLFSLSRIIFTIYILSTGYFDIASGLWIIVWAYFLAICTALLTSNQWLDLALISKKLVIKLLKFGAWLSASSIFGNLYGKLDVLMMAWLISAYETGMYSAAARFITIFPLVVSSLSSVVSPKFAQYDSKKEALIYLRKLVGLVIIIALGMFSLVVLGKFIIITAYSAEFEAAVGLFRFLVIAYIPLVLSVPAANILVYFYKKPYLITWISLSQLLGLFILNLILIPRFGAYGVISAIAIMNLLGTLSQYFMIFKIR